MLSTPRGKSPAGSPQPADYGAYRYLPDWRLSPDTAYQREMVARLRLPFPVLSDARLQLPTTLQLPTFMTSGVTLLNSATLIIDDAMICHVFCPVFPSEQGRR